ncbi:caspase family protein [Lichenifustis flavocetrariae]|uniref:Caspase family protein n=1 Tax=Lichenifustis flavocetrariae TaxID=2949735 RepID=A0AA41YTL1_9HYPH|nr:caspase family protein [Lichenifustis flavocetrariae]MCW6506598.1 caspase family protein [Lichenifustis flavocetrariae]
MRWLKRAIQALAIGIVLAAPIPVQAAEPHRVALVVGIGAYQHLPALPNTVGDARLIADKLRATGFDVDLETDLTKDQLTHVVRDFAHKVEAAGPDAVSAFYYAGHGIQDDKQANFLIGVDAEVKSQVDLPFEALPLDRTLETFEAAHPAVTLVMLDACRDNPLPATSRGVKRGLAVEAERRGLLIAFSTDPGKTADDGPAGSHSPFAAALAEELDVPGLEATALFKVVTKKVMDATKGDQMPWVTQRLIDDFYFRPAQVNGPTPAAAAAAAVTAPSPVPGPAGTPGAPTAAKATPPERGLPPEEAEVAYGRVVLANSVEGYENWLRTYPDDPHRGSVIGLLQRLREEELWKRSGTSSASDAISALETELIAFPNGVYTDRAKQRLAELQSSAPASTPQITQNQSPSFDCSKAGTPVEERICTSPELAERDRRLAQVFADVLAKSSSPLALQIAESQWVKGRDLCATRGNVSDVDACVRTAYDGRIEALQGPTPGMVPTAGRVAPSFNCAYARTPSELLICDSSDLAGADLRLSSLYREALAKGISRQDLDRPQSRWLASRDACASLPARPQAISCIGDVYRHRIDALAVLLGVGSEASVTTPVDPAQACAGFATHYFAAWSDDGADAGTYVEAVYAPQVVFYGRLVTRDQVLDEKRKFMARWPRRSYTVSSLDPPVIAAGRCQLRGVVEWDARRAGSSQVSHGSAHFEFTLTTGPSPQILAESGQVIQRATAPE